MYKAILEEIVMLCAGLSLYSTITVGSLPPDNGISMYLGPGAEEETFMDKGAIYGISVVINAKHQAQVDCISALSSIHDTLTKRKEYPDKATYQIIDIRTSSTPNYIGQEANGQYLYGSIIEVKILSKGVES